VVSIQADCRLAWSSQLERGRMETCLVGHMRMSRPRIIAGSPYSSNKAYCRTLDKATRAWFAGKANHLKSVGQCSTGNCVSRAVLDSSGAGKQSFLRLVLKSAAWGMASCNVPNRESVSYWFETMSVKSATWKRGPRPASDSSLRCRAWAAKRYTSKMYQEASANLIRRTGRFVEKF
jgi:hypothetical protein